MSPAICRGADEPVGSPVDGVQVYVNHMGGAGSVVGKSFYGVKNKTYLSKCYRLVVGDFRSNADTGWRSLPPALEGGKSVKGERGITIDMACTGSWPSNFCDPSPVSELYVHVMPMPPGGSCSAYRGVVDVDPQSGLWQCDAAKAASIAGVPEEEIAQACSAQGIVVINTSAGEATALTQARPEAPASVPPPAPAAPGGLATGARTSARLALLIGNAGYTRPGEKLVNPCRDARAMAQMLRSRLGFEVMEACDLNELAMHRKVEEFASRLRPQGVGLFFYSGHAVEVGGQNYLLPVGHQARTQSDVQVMGYPLERIIEAMESRGAMLNVVLLDACRDNPLPRGTKGATRGLARVDSRAGTIVGFATRAGATAEDGAGSHSPYTQALLETMPLPGLSVPEVLNEAGLRTLEATGRRQEPWLSQSPVPRIYLASAGSTVIERPSQTAQSDSLQVEPPRSETPLADLVGPMVDIPGGTFQMGDLSGSGMKRERPVHTVTVRAFRLGKYEVTRGQFATFVAAIGGLVNNCGNDTYKSDRDLDWSNPGFAQTDDHPVTCVDWFEVQAYIEWLNGKTGQRYRLPTEAEWEYAARAGSAADYAWGNALADICKYANVDDEHLRSKALIDCQDGYDRTAPVGQKLPNAFGLHDMIGNVEEYTQDCLTDSYGGTAVASFECYRVMRGGAWGGTRPPIMYRVSYRGFAEEARLGRYYYGFRLAQDR